MPICLSGVRRAVQRLEPASPRRVRTPPVIHQWPLNHHRHRAGSRRNASSCIYTGTITVPDAQHVSVADVLKHVRPTSRSNLAGYVGDYALLLLLTPGLARAVKDDSLPIDLARHILAARQLPSVLESVTGVVDAVPASSSGQERAEGISYALCKKTDRPILLASTQLRSAANKPGSLSFQLGIRDGSKHQSWEMQLPLSQTIFSTGLTSTLIHRTHESTVDNNEPRLIAERYLENLTFRFPDDTFSRLAIDQFPLVPLTTCQTVKNSMGNIIRTVAVQSSSVSDKREEPASTRLESAVTAYFEALSLPPEPVNVWALIIPQHLMSDTESILQRHGIVGEGSDHLQHIWLDSQEKNGTAQQYSTLLLSLLQSGGRLVKVLSGGGGWGKKAGLLSLDPDLEYSTRELREDFGWHFDFDDGTSDDASDTSIEKGLDQALGSSVEDGDGLIFLLGQKQSTDYTTAIDAPQHTTQLRLGTCRPLEHVALGGDGQTSLQHNTDATSWSDCFGYLSETGMAIKLMQAERLVGKSKLEVPGLSVVARS